jgi:hypothetical protein
MIAVHLTPQGVQNVQITADNDAFKAFDLAVLPIVSEYLEKLDRRLRRLAKEANNLPTALSQAVATDHQSFKRVKSR